MSDELNEFRVRIAGDMVECPCIAPGGLVCLMCADRPTAPTVIHGAACLNCKDTPGRVYRFGDALRVPCQSILCSYPGPRKHCRHCRGRGWVPAENFMPKLLAGLNEAGFAYELTNQKTDVRVPYGIERDISHEQEPDVEARLYRAVLATIGKDA